MALSRELLADARVRLPKGGTELAAELSLIGSSLLKAGAFAEAEPLFREGLAAREKAQPDGWATFNTRSLVGGALVGQKKSADAEPLLLKGYEGIKAREKAIPPSGGTRIPEALDRLVELHTAANKPDEVKKWQAERAKYPPLQKPPMKK